MAQKKNKHLKNYVSLSLVSQKEREDQMVKAATHFSVFRFRGYNHETGDNGRENKRFGTLKEAVEYANKDPRALLYAVISNVVECHIEREHYERYLVLRKEVPALNQLEVGTIYQLTSGHLVQVLQTRGDMKKVKVYILNRGVGKHVLVVTTDNLFARRWDGILPKDHLGPKIPRKVHDDF